MQEVLSSETTLGRSKKILPQLCRQKEMSMKATINLLRTRDWIELTQLCRTLINNAQTKIKTLILSLLVNWFKLTIITAGDATGVMVKEINLHKTPNINIFKGEEQ